MFLEGTKADCIGEMILGSMDFQSVGQNLSDDFVDNVTQTDRSKVMDSMGTRLFRDQSNVNVVLFLQQNVVQEKVPDTTKNLKVYHRPIFLEEMCSEPIRAWSFG